MKTHRQGLLWVAVVSFSAVAVADTPLPERCARLQARWVSSSGALTFRAISMPEKTLRWQRLEAALDLTGTWRNPFDPDDVAIEGILRKPDGREARWPAFYLEGWREKDGKTRLTAGCSYQVDGRRGWFWRFTPDEPGEYHVRFVARDVHGVTAESGERSFTVADAPGAGFVRVSARNPRYFENSGTGQLFWPCGCNLAWTRWEDAGEATYDYYFAKANGNMNATRVWLCHYAWLEWAPAASAKRDRPDSSWVQWMGAGFYNQMIAGDVDRLFEMAERAGIRVMVVTEDNDEHSQHQWPDNPYNRAAGGWCEKPEEVFTNPAARRAYQKRLRYILARWGASPSFWAIDSWNDCGAASPEVVAWISEMRETTHRLCEGIRPIIYGSNFGWAAERVKDYASVYTPCLNAKMPNVIQECWFDLSAYRQTTAESIWSGLAGGIAGVMVWEHNETDRNQCWNIFKLPSVVAGQLRLNEREWKPATTRILSAVIPEEKKEGACRAVSVSSYGDVPGWQGRGPTNRFEVNLREQAAGRFLPGLSPTLYGHRKSMAPYRNPPLFVADFPAAGEFVADVREIGAGTQGLTLSVDGRDMVTNRLCGGRRLTTDTERFVRVKVPSGRHEIGVDVTNGSDWLSVRRYLFLQKLSNGTEWLGVEGMVAKNGTACILFLRNLSYDPCLEKLGAGTPTDLKNVRMQIAGMRDGCFALERIEDDGDDRPIDSGQIAVKEGEASVTLPEIRRHALLVLRMVGNH